MNSKLFSLVILTFFSTTLMHAQIGIGTTNPLEDLHISGNNSTLRIDGINATNNSNNLANVTNGKNAIASADENGNIVLQSLPAGIDVLLNAKNFLPSNYFLDTGTSGQPDREEIYTSPSFTLTQSAVVTFKYSVSYKVLNRAGTLPVSDGKPRLVFTYLNLGDGSTADTSVRYATSAKTYTNSHSGAGVVIDGTMYNSSSDSILLPAGTYSVHMFALIVNYNGSSSSTSDAYSVTFGESTNEFINIIANY